MKLRQIEYCHGCDKHVEFIFDDVPGRQLILCPNCKHEHYREIDGDTIIKIRFSGQHEVLYYDELEQSPISFRAEGDYPDEGFIIKTKKKKVLGVDKEGNAILENNSSNCKVTDRRWGRDPRQ